MQKIEVGKEFSIKNPAGNGDLVIAHINGESFDVICWAGGLSKKEVKEWKKGRLHYGVFIKEDIPFFLIDLPVVKWDFDISFNIHAEKEAGRGWKQFLDGQGNLVNLFLIDAGTNIVKAMRTIGIDHVMAAEIKKTCHKQLAKYKSSVKLNIILNQILSVYSTRLMINSTKMIQHPAT